jgi:hypothetical protein
MTRLPTVALLAVALSAPVAAHAADDIFTRAQRFFEEDDKRPMSKEEKAIDDQVIKKMAAERCLPNENTIVCRVIVLCSQAPQIAGESLPNDDTEQAAALKALDDAAASGDLKKLALASELLKTANEHFTQGAISSRDKCEAAVRKAWAEAK